VRLIAPLHDLVVTAPRRADKPNSPHRASTVMSGSAWVWLEDQTVDDLIRVHGRKSLCDVTPNYVSMVWGSPPPQRISTLRIIDCPTCQAGQAKRMTTCPMCGGATRVLNI